MLKKQFILKKKSHDKILHSSKTKPPKKTESMEKMSSFSTLHVFLKTYFFFHTPTTPTTSHPTKACDRFDLPEDLTANIERCGYNVPTPVQKSLGWLGLGEMVGDVGVGEGK